MANIVRSHRHFGTDECAVPFFMDMAIYDEPQVYVVNGRGNRGLLRLIFFMALMALVAFSCLLALLISSIYL